MEPDCVGDQIAGFGLRLTFRVAALQRRTDCEETTIFIALDDHGELVALHRRIVTEGGVPNGIRTRVAAVKGRCPRPLDDGDEAEAGAMV